ncbi:MAG: hypothetical protein ABIT10_12685 [Alteraurantiacibacter sp.]
MALLPTAALAQSENPTTVNGIEIGPAADFATSGPARVCMQDMVILPQVGETAFLNYSGIHNGSIRLRLANGEDIVFTLGEIFRPQTTPAQGPVWIEGGMRYYAINDGPELFYQVMRLDEEDGRYRPAIHIAGSALSGNRSDRRWVDRVALEIDPQNCTRTYNFGWGVIFGEEPVAPANGQ